MLCTVGSSNIITCVKYFGGTRFDFYPGVRYKVLHKYVPETGCKGIEYGDWEIEDEHGNKVTIPRNIRDEYFMTE